IANELQDTNNPSLKALNRRPELLFLPSRKELSELSRLREWEGFAVERFEPYCNTAKIRGRYGNVRNYLRKASVPYVPYFAYGEGLAATSEKGIELAESFEPLIDLLLDESSERPVRDTRKERRLLKAEPIIFSSLIAVLAGCVILFPQVLTYLSYLIKTTLSPDNSALVTFHLRGGVAGILGGCISTITRLALVARENSLNLNRNSLYIKAVWNIIIGAFAGVAVSVAFKGWPFYLLFAIAGGFMAGSSTSKFLSSISKDLA
ncbi:MAG TPA: hypothetical protein VFQ43_18345, partial [Nitrososphaera sp.]|nr:hypothetical protein [Nitrososphaera sp.]